jgi:glucose-1-phosphate cytidylyltransferase
MEVFRLFHRSINCCQKNGHSSQVIIFATSFLKPYTKMGEWISLVTNLFWGKVMKIIILAGGLGTRISEETFDKPKPMVLLDKNPILWHLMNLFVVQGFNEFIISTGFKNEVIDKWLVELNGEIEIFDDYKRYKFPKFEVITYYTGLKTQTGGRIKRCMERFPKQRMMATYGDGLANVSISKLLEFHESKKRLATVTAVRPPARFGYLKIEKEIVTHIGEKNQADAGWINGGFFVLEPEVADYVTDDAESFESGALARLATEKNLKAYLHYDFWQPMDTLREKQDLAKLAELDLPPWLNLENK